jgi:hypothetical protein
MLDRSTPNLFQPDPSSSDAPTAVIRQGRARKARPATGIKSQKSRAGLSSSRLLSHTSEALRRVASRLRGVARYLPLTIALVVVLSHALAGGGRPTAPATTPTIAPRPRITEVQRKAPLRTYHTTSRPRVNSRPKRAHRRSSVRPHRRTATAATRSVAPVSRPVQPSVTPPPAPVPSTAVARPPSKRGAEFGFEN